jgi:transposase
MPSRAAVEPAPATAARSIIYLGLDVHKARSSSWSCPRGEDAEPRRDGALRACYEASGAGYVLHRALLEWGYACEVIAPSLIPKRSGVQRKRDTRDAADLARLYRAGELTAIRIPSEADERARRRPLRRDDSTRDP